MLNAKKQRELVALFILIAILIAVLFWTGSIPEYAQICEHDKNTGQENCATHHISSVIIWSIGNFLERHNGAITAIATIIIAVFTWRLWWSTNNLWSAAEKSGVVAAVAANAAKASADAAVRASMPILFPAVSEFRSLHDLTPSLSFVFENYGDTPGTIREVRAELRIGDKGLPPRDIKFDELERPQDHEAVVPGGVRGDEAKTLPGSSVPATLDRALALNELAAIKLPANKNGVAQDYKRVYLIGRVIYDDFFGMRYTQTFCIKVMAHGYQAPKGGRGANRRTSQKIPKRDPLE